MGLSQGRLVAEIGHPAPRTFDNKELSEPEKEEFTMDSRIPRLAFAVLTRAAAISTVFFCLAGQSHAVTVSRFASDLYQSLYGITTDGTNLYITGANGILRDFSNGPANGVVGSIPLAGGSLTTLYSS